MHDILIAAVAFLFGELQVWMYITRQKKDRTETIAVIERHLALYRGFHRVDGHNPATCQDPECDLAHTAPR
jgi:hypothetical protein